jgi:O-acetyl-ADP-ribose deacetylase (regulator of RNase III)
MTDIIYRKEDITKCQEKFIAHGCNAKGVYNAGVAKAIRNKYPLAYEDYISKTEYNLGDINPVICGDKLIFNCITQASYGNNSSLRYVNYGAIEDCIIKIGAYLLPRCKEEHRIVALPKIGCGLGGGDWYIVSKIIEENSIYFQPVVYEN